MNPALLLVDFQNDYFPGGAMELAGSPEAAARAANLLRTFRRRGFPVVHLQHVSTRPGATFFLPGTPGCEVHGSVAPAPGEAVFRKGHPNGFRETGLLAHLRGLGVSHLVIAGMMTHMCIDSTARAAADLGFRCLLAGDACATRALPFEGALVAAENVQAAFLAALDGPFATVSSAAEICAGL